MESRTLGAMIFLQFNTNLILHSEHQFIKSAGELFPFYFYIFELVNVEIGHLR